MGLGRARAAAGDRHELPHRRRPRIGSSSRGGSRTSGRGRRMPGRQAVSRVVRSPGAPPRGGLAAPRGRLHPTHPGSAPTVKQHLAASACSATGSSSARSSRCTPPRPSGGRSTSSRRARRPILSPAEARSAPRVDSTRPTIGRRRPSTRRPGSRSRRRRQRSRRPRCRAAARVRPGLNAAATAAAAAPPAPRRRAAPIVVVAGRMVSTPRKMLRTRDGRSRSGVDPRPWPASTLYPLNDVARGGKRGGRRNRRDGRC